MSANGLSEVEDAEMQDCEGDKVVTMMDVLQEQQDFEDDANAVLGASDEKNCTYSKGYIKRQAIYACLTCCADAKTDPSQRAGVCLACSLSCHEDHELIELYTKRNFRCDCGNPKFNSHPCHFTPNKTDLNEENSYNQNFCGIYCICHKPYPDPEETDEDEMIQCIICEDWLHSSHLDATVPAPDMFSEMICKACMEKNDFLHDYSHIAVNSESMDMNVSINESTFDNTAPACNGDSLMAKTSCAADVAETSCAADVAETSCAADVAETSCTADVAETSSAADVAETSCAADVAETCVADEIGHIDAGNNDVSLTTNGNIEMEPIIMSVEGNISMDEQNKDSNEINNGTLNGDENPINDSNENKELPEKVVDTEVVSKVSEFIDKETAKAVTNDDKIENEILTETNEFKNNVETDQNSKKSNDKETSELSYEEEGTKTSDCIETQLKETNNEDVNNSGENNHQDREQINRTDEDSINKEVKKNDAAITSFVQDSVSENINSDVQLENLSDEFTPNETDNEQEINKESKPEEKTSPEKTEAFNVIPETDLLNSDEKETNEHKRKLSSEDTDGGITKKAKLDESRNCIRPKGVIKVLKGASFWPSNFRQKLCTCNECISMYKDLSVLYLTDLDDTVSAYEMLGKERVDGTATQYEKGLEALASLDTVQQINALTEYNNLRDKLLDFLKSFKDRKEVVKEEDIKEFFAGMKPKRESDGVYFCR